MAGDRTVGRVSIRVIPDTRGFDQALRRELAKIKDIKVPVNFDPDSGAVDAELAKLRSEKISIPADVKLNQDQLGRALAGIKKIDIPAQIKINQDTVGRALAGRKITIPAEVKVDRDPFKAMLRGITSDVGTTFKGIGQVGAQIFKDIGQVGADAFNGVGSALGSVASAAGTAAVALLVIPGIATAIAVAGATITAAWGTISTVIAAIPAAIGLIGAPIAAVLLGMKGIQAAARVLKPEFDNLKNAVSATFQQGLTPVFNQLKGSLTALTPSIQAVATSMVGLAQKTANFITTGGGLALIQTLFQNVATAIGQIDLTPLLDGFIRLAGNQAALKALTGTINQLGLEIQKIANNASLNAAFTGLEGVLRSLTTAFGALVNNGIKLFAAAAPGIQATVDAITGFFGRFDYAALGASISQVFSGIASAIKQISPSTISAIQGSFQKLGATFADPGFQQGLAGFAKAIPPVIDGINLLVNAFSLVGSAVGGFIDGISKINASLQTGINNFLNFGNEAGRVLGTLPKTAETNLSTLPPILQRNLGLLPPIATMQGTATVSSFVAAIQPLPAQAGGILSGLPTFLDKELAPLPGLFSDRANAARLGFGVGIKNMSAETAAQLGLIPPAAKTALDPLAATAIPTVVSDMANAVNAAFPGVGTAFQTGYAALGALTVASLGALSTSAIPIGMQLISASITTGFTSVIAPAMTLGLAALGVTFIAGFGMLATTGVLPGMMLISAAITAGFTGVIAPAMTLGLAALGVTFVAGFGMLATTGVAPGMALIAAAITAGFTGIVGPAMTAGVASLGVPLLAGFGALASGSVAAGMALIAAAVTAGFVAVNAAITAGFATATATFRSGFTGIQSATTAFGTLLVATIKAAMTQFTTAVKTGMDQALAAVKAGIAAILAAMNSGAGQARAAGVNLGNAFAQGVASTEGAARAAGAKVGAAAVAGLNSAKGIKAASPSKKGIASGEFLGKGFIIGLDNMHRDVARSAADLGAYAADQIMSQFNGGLDGLDFNAKLEAFVGSGAFNNSGSSTPQINLGGVSVQIGDERIKELVRVIVGEAQRRLGAELAAR